LGDWVELMISLESLYIALRELTPEDGIDIVEYLKLTAIAAELRARHARSACQGNKFRSLS
jgi:hypothetical protein